MAVCNMTKTKSTPDGHKYIIIFFWITPPISFSSFQLAMNPNNDPTINELVQKYDWYLLPLVNPDGYEYSRTNVSCSLKYIFHNIN